MKDEGRRNAKDLSSSYIPHPGSSAVIAITNQGLLQRFAKASASARESNMDRLVESMPLPWSNYRDHVERGLSHIFVSHKPDHGYQGAMHEETAWGLRENGQVTRNVRPEGGGQKVRLPDGQHDFICP